MGDFYERLVGMVKSSLGKTIGRTHLTQTQFTTFTAELEGIINSQSLVYIDDINLTSVRAPMHGLSLNSKIGTPRATEDLYHDGPDYKPKKETSGKRDKYILITIICGKSGMMNSY